MRITHAIIFRKNLWKTFSKKYFLKKNFAWKNILKKILQKIFLWNYFSQSIEYAKRLSSARTIFCSRVLQTKIPEKKFSGTFAFVIASAHGGERVQNSNTNAYVSGAVHRHRAEERLSKYTVLFPETQSPPWGGTLCKHLFVIIIRVYYSRS